ncbi:unnamed protein product [Mesocestoides corti]|uniref:IlGF domain-containing protein n=1 Tax=Mesocestoides corti TaxID=53468 RepID=A0A0R3U8Q8_MESCO|nr:unnamed protein product [Mesocestoides corti]
MQLLSTLITNPNSDYASGHFPLLLLLVFHHLNTAMHTEASPLESALSVPTTAEDIVLRKAPFTPTSDLQVEQKRGDSDPRRIMCGYQLIVNLKLQCGDRGTFSPYERGPRTKRGLHLGGQLPPYNPFRGRGRLYDDLCSLYLQYEPYTIVTECCCRGCTRRFLEQFCAKT